MTVTREQAQGDASMETCTCPTQWISSGGGCMCWPRTNATPTNEATP